jgi:hypothetical protein
MYPILKAIGDNPMKKFVIICITLTLISPLNALSLEKLTNEALSSISGKAVTENPAFNLPDIALPSIFSDQFLMSFSQSNSLIGNSESLKTVAVDFFGKLTTDDFGNEYRDQYFTNIEIEDFYYESGPYKTDNAHSFSDKLYTQFVFDGILKAKIIVPEYFDNNPSIKTKDLNISQSRIDLPEGSTGNYICSYQGNIFEAGLIPESDKVFPIYPNRQTITVGRAENEDLMLLLPRGTGQQTVWGPVVKNYNPETSEVEYLVIPEGKKFIHIGLNHMVSRMDMNLTLRFSHSEKQMKNISEEMLIPENIGQTLGTFTMNGGDTRINGGDVIITINDSL